MKKYFEISKSHIIISQSIKKFIAEISNHKTEIIKPVKIEEPRIDAGHNASPTSIMIEEQPKIEEPPKEEN